MKPASNHRVCFKMSDPHNTAYHVIICCSLSLTQGAAVRLLQRHSIGCSGGNTVAASILPC